MTVNTITGKISYAGDGATSTFTFPFPGIDPSFIQVTVVDSLGNITTPTFTAILNPTVAPNPTSQGGTVTLSAPLPVGSTITIVRNLPVLQGTSLSNQSIIYPPVVEKALDYLTLLDQSVAVDTSRFFRVGPQDPPPLPVPPVAARANLSAFWDPAGNLTAGGLAPSSVFVSAAMIPVVGATTLALARQAMGISVPPVTVSGTYAVTQANDRQVLNLTGGFYNVNFDVAANYSSSFWTFVYNSSGRGKEIVIPGDVSFILWPTQFIWVFNFGTLLLPTNPNRWVSLAPQNFYVDPVNGLDTNDGLAPGTGAFKTIQQAINIVETQVDGTFTINLADGTYMVGNGVMCNKSPPGSVGYSIIGNVSSPNNVVINANSGNICVTARNTAVVTIRGVNFTISSGTTPVPTDGCISATNNGVIIVGNVTFGAAGNGAHIAASYGGVVQVDQPYHINAGSGAHLRPYAGGTIRFQPNTVTFDQSMTFLHAFIWATGGTIFNVSGLNTFVNSGFVSAPQYDVSYNSTVLMNPSPGYPGSTAGVVNTGGQIA